MRSAAVALVLVVAALAVAAPARAQPGVTPRGTVPLTDGDPGTEPDEAAPTVELYTFEVGEIVFQKFGHAALCLAYEVPRRQTVCFNYGITDYNAGGDLVWGFLRGTSKFWVAAEPLRQMLRPYQLEDRTIWRQVLPLTPAQAKLVEAKLWWDAKPENRYYYYDHFFDNCSTRLRDILDDATGGLLRRDTTGRTYPLTFREAGARGLGTEPAILALGDFAVGRALSRKPTAWEAMFLPDVLRAQVATSYGVTAEVVYARQAPRLPWPTDAAPPRTFGRWATLLVAFGFALPLLLARWRRRFQRLALGWAMVPLVFWGLLLTGLVLVSSIPSLRWNEAILVLTPLDLAIPFLGERRRRLYALARVALLLLVSILCAIDVFKQPLWVPIITAFLPLAIIAFDLPHFTPLPAKGAAAEKPKPKPRRASA